MRPQKVLVGSGWWSNGGAGPRLIGHRAPKAPEFFGLWLHLVRRYIDPDHIVVVDSHSPLKPAPDLQNTVTWIELDQNYGHAADIAAGTVITKYCGFTRSVLLGAVYALCTDADLFCYVEQDCVVHGHHLIRHALAGREPTVMVGARTEGGVGVGGRQAGRVHQQSLMLVGRASLERFISGLMAGPESDGELGPERKLERDWAPFEILEIPYGRSRPIDFSTPCFYAQHLTGEELTRFCELEGVRPDDFGLVIEDC
jgi:hypothetical protein